jgi:zinc/manganese transport system permease protein
MTAASQLLAGRQPVAGQGHLLGQPFIQHALAAGSAIALLSGLVGYFMVLRGQVFAGDALSHVAYAGALAALAAGVDLRFGLFASTVAVGVGLGLVGGRTGADDVVIGTTFAWVLGLGVFFLAYYTRHGSGGNGTASVTVLFGSIFGISGSAALVAVLVALGLIAVLLSIARPLLFASVDPVVAAARGIPVRLLGALFLGVTGASAAEASQAVGALLLFGLLAVLAVWVGLAISYAAPKLPASFSIMSVATAEYALAALLSAVSNAAGRARTPRRYG